VVFKLGLKIMPDLYASPLGTCVLQLPDVPIRPERDDGRVFVCALSHSDAAMLSATKAMLSCFGPIDVCHCVEIEEVRLTTAANLDVRFKAHTSAVRAVKSSRGDDATASRFDRSVVGSEAYLAWAFNQLCYHERGWCIFEEAVSLECLCHFRASLQALERPKVCEIIESDDLEVHIRTPPRLGARTDLSAALRSATFSGKGDQLIVTALHRSYQKRLERLSRGP